jgi:hypothetical protein
MRVWDSGKIGISNVRYPMLATFSPKAETVC